MVVFTSFLWTAILAAQPSAAALLDIPGRVAPFARALDKRQILPKVTWGHTVFMDTKSEYIYLSTVFTPGKPPPNPKGSLFLWPGLFEPENYQKTNLIQSVTEQHTNWENKQICGAEPGQWCVRPFVVDYSATPLSKYPARGKAIDPTDRIKIEYTKKPGGGGNWTQKVTNLSKGNAVLFEWEWGNKRTNRLHFATEYQGGSAMTVDTQKYWNTTVRLKDAEAAVGSRLRTSPKGIVQTTLPYTRDSGKNWHIDEITFLPMDTGAAGSKPKPPGGSISRAMRKGFMVHVQ